jgi:hypothetical protein
MKVEEFIVSVDSLNGVWVAVILRCKVRLLNGSRMVFWITFKSWSGVLIGECSFSECVNYGTFCGCFRDL